MTPTSQSGLTSGRPETQPLMLGTGASVESREAGGTAARADDRPSEPVEHKSADGISVTIGRDRPQPPPEGALQVVAEVAHDMRSPATSILFLVDLLRTGRSGAVNDRQVQQLGLIYTAALGLSELASDLVDLVRGVDKLVDQDPIAFSVSQLLQSVVDIVQPMVEEKKLILEVVQPRADVRVGYPAALNRILLNLTTNAIKFTEQGSVQLSARELHSSWVEFSVQDSGRGIPAEVLPRLFEPFRTNCRAGSAMFSSSGLGLSICRKLVTALGSELHVATAVGRGTRFSFGLDLPAVSTSAPPA
jgi:signal transduction histidine kinase